MDKTGTITEGNFQLQKVVATGKYTENELLSMCAGCEQNSTHPIANSIVAAAKEREIQFENRSPWKKFPVMGSLRKCRREKFSAEIAS